MRQAKPKNTGPELQVRKIAHDRRAAIASPVATSPSRLILPAFHAAPRSSSAAASGMDMRLAITGDRLGLNSAYWTPKLAKNKERDARAAGSLQTWGGGRSCYGNASSRTKTLLSNLSESSSAPLNREASFLGACARFHHRRPAGRLEPTPCICRLWRSATSSRSLALSAAHAFAAGTGMMTTRWRDDIERRSCHVTKPLVTQAGVAS